jgi:arylsulfatase
VAGKDQPRVSNDVVSIHDWFPTLASIIGAQVPADRPMDGVDQARSSPANCGNPIASLITIIGEEVAAVRWRQFRIYPKQFTHSPGNPAMYGLAGVRLEGNGFPVVFNIEADQREEVNVLGTNAWVIGPYLKVIGEYLKSLEKHPNPRAVNMTEFGK